MLNPYYIVGFVDGEGCFFVSISKIQSRLPEVRLIFEIELREVDSEIIERIRDYFNCGNIYHLNYEKYSTWKPHVKYKVSSFKNIKQNIIPFFTKYKLQAKKKKKFEFFCQIASFIDCKKHRTVKGIEYIKNLRESFRNGI